MALRARVARDGVKETAHDTMALEMLGLNSMVEAPLPSFRQFRYQLVEEAEKSYLLQLVAASGNDFQQAIEISGLGKTRLYNLFRKHDISI
jgi:DNA-binding NtrC family response regulator